MSETRLLISIMKSRAMTHDSDWARLLDEWDIRADRNIAPLEANYWLQAQIADQTSNCDMDVPAGMDNDEWDSAVEFVWRCLRNGVVPHEYVHLLIDRQQAWID